MDPSQYVAEENSGFSLVPGSVPTSLPIQTRAPLPIKRQLSPEELVELKPIIEKMYIQERKTFPHVKLFLLENYNYDPTKRQFYGMISKWGFKKNTKQDEREEILSSHHGGTNRVGAVALNRKKLNRWKREARAATPPARVPIIHEPVSPEVFQMSETLFSRLTVYLTGSYEHGTWVSVDGKPVMNIKNGESKAGNLDTYLGSCLSATNLITLGSYVEARKVLSNACAQLHEIIRVEDPLTLHYFTEIYTYMLREKSPEVQQALDIIRSYLGRLANTILPLNHPFRDIINLLGTIDSSQLDGTILQIFNCIATVFSKHVGPLQTNTFAARLLAIQTKYREYLPGEMSAMRALLEECKAAPDTETQIFQVMGDMTSNLIRRDMFVEAEASALEFYERALENGAFIKIIMGHLLVARAQYGLGKQESTIWHQREVVRINLELPADEYLPWAISHLGTLERWVRDWGRIEEADSIKAEREELIERRTRDEDLIEEINET